MLKARIQKHWGKPLLFHGFVYVHYTTHGTYSFTSHPKDEAIMVKCLAQGHKHRDRPGQDSNPHSENIRNWVQCTRPLGHDTTLTLIPNTNVAFKKKYYLLFFYYVWRPAKLLKSLRVNCSLLHNVIPVMYIINVIIEHVQTNMDLSLHISMDPPEEVIWRREHSVPFYTKCPLTENPCMIKPLPLSLSLSHHKLDYILIFIV